MADNVQWLSPAQPSFLLWIIPCTAAGLIWKLNLGILKSKKISLIIDVSFYCRESQKKGAATETGKREFNLTRMWFYSFFPLNFHALKIEYFITGYTLGIWYGLLTTYQKLIPKTDNCFLFSASKSAGGLSSLKGAPSLGNSGLGSLKGAPPLLGMNNNNRGESFYKDNNNNNLYTGSSLHKEWYSVRPCKTIEKQ